MKTLLQLVVTSQEIETMLINNGGEITPEIEELLEVNSTDIISKVDNYNFIMEKLSSNEAYWKAKATEYAAYAKSFAKAQERIKDHLKMVMQAHELKEIVGNEVRYTLRPSVGSLVVDDASKLPNEYLIVTTSPNNAAIKKDLAAGKQIEGAHIEAGYTLSKYNKKA
jgi:hypothetical protein